jgi:hypothetical protein
MDFLYNLFAPPHELLHILALRLIGRNPKAVARRHVDIPEDLTTPQYVFVAGLPAFVFWTLGGIGLVVLLNAPNVPALVLGWMLMLVGGLGGFGTIGDLQLIYQRIMNDTDQDG